MILIDFRVVVPAAQADEIRPVVQSIVERVAGELDEVIPSVEVAAEPDGDTVLIRATASAEPEEDDEEPPHLTPRQWQILKLLDRGLLSKQIASELGLSTYTVSNHIHAILRKFDAPSRTRALHRARRLRLI
ncbi:MAG: helix-turn-helix transcriptional regulator [Actinobacteria bacterium]|nr:helix-turn-helix transcriptional regulator [Actinomycetota bacterium]MBV8561794.1 helix-turn-helix transcriptional regulator [Actinomycetota bacterium]